MTSSTTSRLHPRLRRFFSGWVDGWNRTGGQTQFYAFTLRSTYDAVVHYKVEIVRLIAQMSLGTGALALIGGTVVVVGFLTLSAGALVAVQGYNQLSGIGVEALTGFVSAYVNVRLLAPVNAGIALAARSVPAQPHSSERCGSPRRSTHWKSWAFGLSPTWPPREYLPASSSSSRCIASRSFHPSPPRGWAP